MIPATQEPVPADFAEVATGQTIRAMRVHYQRGFPTVKRWFAEAGVEVAQRSYDRHKRRPMPDDFRAIFSDMSIMVLRKHYSASARTITRWIAEAGQVRRAGNQKRKAPAVKAAPKRERQPNVVVQSAKRAPVMVSHKPNNPASATRVQRDMSAAGQAADVLRRDRWVVFRADENRRQSATGQFWVCGKALLTSAELIERAERAERRMAA